ncbi:MAG: response regulator [Spirochaetia bacterium]|nr:response regulator [Spirochaetia bacterium]
MELKTKIIFIEDNEHDLIAFKRLIKRKNLNYELTEFTKVEDAKEFIFENHQNYDLLVTDNGLPGISGIELCKTLISQNIEIPKIILTGSDSTEIAIEALKLGVSDYIIKDYSQNYLNLLPLVFEEVISRFKNKSETQKAQTALVESESRLKNLFESTSDLIQSITNNGKIIFVNRAWKETLGYSDEEIKNLNIFDIIDPAEKEKCIKIFEQLLNNPNEIKQRIETTFITKDKHKIIVEGSSNCYCQNNIPMATVSIFRDITRRKQTEEALRKAKEKADEASKLKSIFLANTSHDIRTPLNGIIGFTNLLLQEEHSSETKEYLEMIKRSGDLLLMLINDILDLSKIESGEMKIEKSACLLEWIFDDVEITAKMFMTQKNKKLKLKRILNNNFNRNILVDSLRVKQIMNNLMSNAIKFTKDGTIEFGAFLKENFLEFYVKDEGIGISLENQKKIFQPFKQAEPDTTHKYGGTGLGLAISKNLVKFMGGKMRIESNPKVKKGTVFYFTIPYEPANEKNSITNRPKEIETSYAFDVQENKNYTILIAEDNPVNQVLTKTILKKAGFSTIITSDGFETVKEYKNNKSIDLILMDIQMPVMNGLHATSSIRFIESTNNIKKPIPIIALTAEVMKKDIEKCEEAGCNDFVSKPVNQEVLLRKILQYLNNIKLIKSS